MAEDYTVKEGDCITSIADAYGFFTAALWDHEDNAELKELRQDPNALMPGDVVHIPDKETKTATCETGETHTFCAKGIQALFRLQLVDGDLPQPGVPFELEVEDQTVSGTSDDKGIISATIRAAANTATLRLGEAPDQEEFEVKLGHLPPVSEIEGVQARLANLHIYFGPIDGELNEETVAAIKAFQVSQGQEEPSGELDQATLDALDAEQA